MDKVYPEGLDNVHGLWTTMSRVCPAYEAFLDPANNVTMTFSEAAAKIESLAGQLQASGIKKGDKLSVFAENSYKWLLLDGATLKCGAANVVRGVAAPLDELEFIFKDSGSVACVMQTVDLLQRLGPIIMSLDQPPS